MLAQYREPERMKGVNRNFVCPRAKGRLQALAHFGGGAAGEGDGKAMFGGDAAFGDQMDDALGERAGFSRAGSGDNEERAVNDGRRRALVVVEGGQDAGGRGRFVLFLALKGEGRPRGGREGVYGSRRCRWTPTRRLRRRLPPFRGR